MSVTIPVWCIWTIPCVLLVLWLAWAGERDTGYFGGASQAIGCLFVAAIYPSGSGGGGWRWFHDDPCTCPKAPAPSSDESTSSHMYNEEQNAARPESWKEKPSSDETPPQWITKAADEIDRTEQTGEIYADKIAAIIAKHAPKDRL